MTHVCTCSSKLYALHAYTMILCACELAHECLCMRMRVLYCTCACTLRHICVNGRPAVKLRNTCACNTCIIYTYAQAYTTNGSVTFWGNMPYLKKGVDLVHMPLQYFMRRACVTSLALLCSLHGCWQPTSPSPNRRSHDAPPPRREPPPWSPPSPSDRMMVSSFCADCACQHVHWKSQNTWPAACLTSYTWHAACLTSDTCSSHNTWHAACVLRSSCKTFISSSLYLFESWFGHSHVHAHAGVYIFA